MPSKKKYLNFLIFILAIKIISSFKYPINEQLNKAELGEVTSVEVSLKEEFDKYIIQNEYVISIFHADWCGHCKRFLPVFDEASRYKIINNKWKFLKIPCSKYEYLCNSFSIEGYPTIKTFKQSKEIKLRVPRELDNFLEYLLKISSNPLVEIENNNVQNFYKNYGTFSPLIEYNSKNTEFISCIKELANKEFLTEYYFGLVKKDDEKEGKIIFDFDKNNIIHFWDGNCKEIKTFLNNNLFPLVSHIDVAFMMKMNRYKKLIFMLFYHSDNNEIKNFIEQQYKNISKENREIVFGYVIVNKDFDIANYFKVNNIIKDSEIQIVIYDFDKEIAYKHPKIYDINSIKESILEKNIKELIKNINNLPFTSGSKFKDFMRKIGLADLSDTTKIILMVMLFLLFIICICFFIFYCDFENNEDYNEVGEELLRKRMKKEKGEKKEKKENKTKEKKETKEVENKINDDKIEKIKKD